MRAKFWWIAGAVVTVVAVVVAGVFIATRWNATKADQAAADAGSWTFMVYMIGDTNLEPYALDDLTEMASVGSTDDVNIVAVVDRSPDYSTDGVENLDDWEDTKLLHVEDDSFEVVDELGELNMGDPDTLSDFVVEASAAYPAENYGLVLWDHGAGWPGVGPDETDGEDVLELAEIDAALTDGLGRAGIEQLDLMGFDACLMATYEVASVIAEHADYLVASQEVEPGHGWNYGSLQALSDDPSLAVPDLGAEILAGFESQAVDEETESDITLALLDLSAMPALHDALAGLADAYEGDAGGFGPEFATAQRGVLSFGRDPDPELATNQIDLGEFTQNLADTGAAELADPAAAVDDALDALVIDGVTGDAMQGASGLSVYFPVVEDYFSEDYLALDMVPSWPDVLAAYYASGDALSGDAVARFEADENGFDITFDEDGVNFVAAVPEEVVDSIATATVSVGYRDGDDVVYLAEMPAELEQDDDGAYVSAEYDYAYLTIGDGENEIIAYQDITTDPDTGYQTIDVPLEYVAAGDDVDEYSDAILSLVLDGDGAIIEEDFYLLDESGTYGAISPDPDAELYPVALVRLGDGGYEYERSSDDGIAADLDALEFAHSYLESGTMLTIDADIWDYGSNTDTVSTEVELP